MWSCKFSRWNKPLYRNKEVSHVIAKTILTLARTYFGIFIKLDEARLNRTIVVEAYYSNLAQTIEDTSADLKGQVIGVVNDGALGGL